MLLQVVPLAGDVGTDLDAVREADTAIFRSAEFGLRGVVVETRVQTPRFCGAPASAGVSTLPRFLTRPLRIS